MELLAGLSGRLPGENMVTMTGLLKLSLRMGWRGRSMIWHNNLVKLGEILGVLRGGEGIDTFIFTLNKRSS
jgi:hypothetical protein